MKYYFNQRKKAPRTEIQSAFALCPVVYSKIRICQSLNFKKIKRGEECHKCIITKKLNLKQIYMR